MDYRCFILRVSLFFAFASSAPQKKMVLPFPTLVPGLPPYEQATPWFTFDGIDYDELPEKLKFKSQDCWSHHLTCIRDRSALNHVCTYDTEYYWAEGKYYSLCEVELKNCVHRIYWKHGIYGTYGNRDRIFYVADTKEDGNAHC